MLDELILLAQDPSPAKRTELLSAVADLFVDPKTERSEVSVELFRDIVTRLLNEVEAEELATLSQTIAPCEQTPTALVERFAREDDVAVAGPILRSSPVLSDAVLVDIASSKSQAHLKEISKREQLAAEVTDVIVDRGDQDVIRTVASNAGAAFSQHGFGRLAEHAAKDEKLVEHLFGRTDVPKTIAGQLLDGLSDAARARLEKLASRNVAIASNIVRKAAASIQPDSEPATTENTLNARAVFISIKSGKVPIDVAVTQLVRRKHFGDLAFVLGKLVDIPASEMRAALSKTDLTAVAVVCKTLQVSNAAFRQLAMLIGAQLSLPESHINHFAGRYETLDAKTAERTLRFLTTRRQVMTSLGGERRAS